MILSAIAFVMFGLYFGYQKHQISDVNSLTTNQTFHDTVIVRPDEYQVNGDQLSGVGQVQSLNRRIQFFARIESEDEQKFLMSNSRQLEISMNFKLSELNRPTNFNQADFRYNLWAKKVYLSTKKVALLVSIIPMHKDL